MLVFLLDDNTVNARVLLWDGTGHTSSSNVLGRRICGSEFARRRSRLSTSLPCSERCSEFARLRWYEREAALATGGASGGGGRSTCAISCLVGIVAGGGGLLAQQPIVRREDEGYFQKRTLHGIFVSIESGHVQASKKVGTWRVIHVECARRDR